MPKLECCEALMTCNTRGDYLTDKRRCLNVADHETKDGRKVCWVHMKAASNPVRAVPLEYVRRVSA